MSIETRVPYDLSEESVDQKLNGSIEEKQPSIPNLPSKETLAYARKVSEQLNYNNNNNSITINGVNFQNNLGDNHVLKLSTNMNGIRRQSSNYSSIGSGNLASESGTSHTRYETGSELEQFHMQDAFYQLGSDYYNSNVSATVNSKITVAPPRSKNRPKSQIYLSNENMQEPPSINVQYVDDSNLKTDDEGGSKTTGYKQNNGNEDNQRKGKDEDKKGQIDDYLQRYVPEEPVKTNNNRSKGDENHSLMSDDGIIDGNNKTLSSQQQRNINTISQLLSIVNNSTVGAEFERLAIPNEEKVLLEQFIDALSRLAVDIFLDPSRREEILRRLNSSARALEGF